MLLPPPEPIRPIQNVLVSLLIACGFFVILEGVVIGPLFVIGGLGGCVLEPIRIGVYSVSVVGGFVWFVVSVGAFKVAKTWVRERNQHWAQEALPRFEAEHARWRSAVTRWNSLYYCFLDDLVFDPETAESCQPQETHQFILRGA